MAPCLPNQMKSKPVEQQVFPDSGASLCLAKDDLDADVDRGIIQTVPVLQEMPTHADSLKSSAHCHETKAVDDCLLYDFTIEQSFWHA